MRDDIADGGASVLSPFSAAPASTHSDLHTPGWFGFFPASWRPYLLLARMDRPIGSWLLFLPGLWGILLGRPSIGAAIRLALLFGIGSIVMRAAGCVVNDMWDRDIDRQVPRTATRPLASGLLNIRQAGLFLIGLLTIGLLILLQLPLLCWALGVASLLPIALYPAAKRVTHWPQAVLGLTFGFSAPMGYAASAGAIAAPFWTIYLASILWALNYDTIYAHQDRDADSALGLGSTAIRLGEKTKPFVAACAALVIACVAASAMLAHLGPSTVLALAPAAIAMIWQSATVDIHDPRKCLESFRFSRWIGIMIAAALAVALRAR